MTNTARVFHIHGDNVVECERFLDQVQKALVSDYPKMKGPYGSPTNPSFEFVTQDRQTKLKTVFYPGFGRWDQDVAQLIRNRGGIIRENADVILTEVRSGQEIPLLAIEYSGALSAGNQAWQRSGRAYSFGMARVPFLYVAELGGHELDGKRAIRSLRLPNPAVPFSYLSFSSVIDTPVLPVFVANPGLDREGMLRFASVLGENQLIDFIRSTMLMLNVEDIEAVLKRKTLELIKDIASNSMKGNTLEPSRWEAAYEKLHDQNGETLVAYLLSSDPVVWAKKAYIKSLTPSAKLLMNLAARFSIGLSSSKLPLCIVPTENRASFARQITRLYPNLDRTFVEWLESDNPLVIAWVMGFKPGGDDARPDRGLPLLTRMLVGTDTDMLTVVYGPAPKVHLSLLKDNPHQLARQNGLWEAIMVASDALLVDSATDSGTHISFLNSHWHSPVRPSPPTGIFVSPAPQRIGEQDVDTVIHTLFARLAGPQVFEGMCNPPGGDWSGVSLLTPNKSHELRWLSLPRVSKGGSKRPDHVLELFDLTPTPIVFAIESKETHGRMEIDIGVRLTAYMKQLIVSPPNIQRINCNNAEWEPFNTHHELSDYIHASGVAFLMSNPDNLYALQHKTKADVIIGIQFDTNSSTCQFNLLATSDIGQCIAELINEIPLGDLGFSVRIYA